MAAAAALAQIGHPRPDSSRISACAGGPRGGLCPLRTGGTGTRRHSHGAIKSLPRFSTRPFAPSWCRLLPTDGDENYQHLTCVCVCGGAFFGVPAALRCQRTLGADELLRSSRSETLQIVRGGNDVLTLKFTVHLKCSLSPALMPIPCLMRTLVVGLGRVCVTAILGSRKPSRGTIMGIHGSSPLFTKSLML